jgi:hypothetical protein
LRDSSFVRRVRMAQSMGIAKPTVVRKTEPAKTVYEIRAPKVSDGGGTPVLIHVYSRADLEWLMKHIYGVLGYAFAQEAEVRRGE